MSRSDDERVVDILTSCERIIEIAVRGRGACDEDWEGRDAARYNLVIVGEALVGCRRIWIPETPTQSRWSSLRPT